MTVSRYTRDGVSYYRHPLGIPGEFLGVTGVCEHVDPFDGTNWGIGLGVEAALEVGNVESAKALARQRRHAAADKGTAVHTYLERRLKGEAHDGFWDNVDGHDIDGHCQAVERFLNDWVVDVQLVEAEVFNVTYGYAGTCDLWNVRLRTGVTVGADLKTGKLKPIASVQAAAYRNAEHAVVDGQMVPMPPVDACILVGTNDDGTYQIVPLRADAHDFAIFCRSIELVRWQAVGALGTAIAGPPVYATAERHDWLRGRLRDLIDAGADPMVLANQWPTHIPTLAAGQPPLTDRQIDNLDALIADWEGYAGAQWPDLDPRRAEVKAAKTDLLARVEQLPADLAAPLLPEVVMLGELAGAEKVAALTSAVFDAELTAADRAGLVDRVLDGGEDAAVLLAAVTGRRDRVALTDAQLEHLCELVVAIDDGLLEVAGDQLTVTKTAEVRLLKAYGTRTALIAAAKDICRATGEPLPKSSGDVIARPLLAVRCWTAGNNNHHDKETAA